MTCLVVEDIAEVLSSDYFTRMDRRFANPRVARRLENELGVLNSENVAISTTPWRIHGLEPPTSTLRTQIRSTSEEEIPM
jgi:hypothetical protein